MSRPRDGGQRRYDLDRLRRIKFIRMASREQLAAIGERIADLGRLRATIEECLACGCRHARRCKLLSAPPRRAQGLPRRP